MNRFYTKVFILVLFFISRTANSQDTNDSLSHKNYDELKKKYNSYSKKDSLKAKHVYKAYMKKARLNKDTLHMAEAYFLNYYHFFPYPNLSYFDSIINITKNKPSTRFPAKAYFRRAQYFLYMKRDMERALGDLKQAKTYSDKYTNTILSNRINYLMGIIKSEHLNEKEEAIAIFKKSARFYASLKGKYENFGNHNYLNVLIVTSETFMALKMYDSAQYYNRLGYSIASKYTDKDLNSLKYYFTLTEGVNQYNLNNYNTAIDSLTRALPKMILFKEKTSIIDSYFYLAKSYYDNSEKEKAIFNFKKTDSVLETLNSIPKYEHVKTYEYLKNYYTSIKDIKNQNLYLNKLNTVLDKYVNDRISISKKVKEDYDIRLLKEEQEALVVKLNTNKKNYFSNLFILTVLLIISASLVFYQYKKRKRSQIRFEKLLNEQEYLKTPPYNTSVVKKEILNDVPQEIVTHILKRLEKFENDLGFLEPDLKMGVIAKKMKTNSSYFSKVVNVYKKKNFTNYINDLRVDYCIKKLRSDTKLRLYSIESIGKEIGFSNAQSFSRAFIKKTKITPSYFLKKLNND